MIKGIVEWSELYPKNPNNPKSFTFIRMGVQVEEGDDIFDAPKTVEVEVKLDKPSRQKLYEFFMNPERSGAKYAGFKKPTKTTRKTKLFMWVVVLEPGSSLTSTTLKIGLKKIGLMSIIRKTWEEFVLSSTLTTLNKNSNSTLIMFGAGKRTKAGDTIPK